jgi:Xaa-Pro aminopeptidase
MERRSFLGAGTAGVAGLVAGDAAALAPAALHGGAGGAMEADREWEALSAAMRSEPLLNYARAREVMEKRGFDGLVLVRAQNVYNAANFWPLTDRMGHAPSCAVVVPRDPKRRASLVIPQFTFYYIYSDAGPRSFLEHYLYAPEGALHVFNQVDPTALSDKEKRRLADLARVGTRMERTFVDALALAIREAGLERGRLGVDDELAMRMIAAAQLPATAQPALEDVAFVRMVKSPLEIRMMRAAATRNVEATLAAVRGLRDGMSIRELRTRYFMEAAERGMTGVFMVVDKSSVPSYDQPLRAGHGILIDCVSHLGNYHGDYGRTVVIGEPSRAMKRATDAMGFAWSAIRERLRPGLTTAEIRRIGTEALKKGGYATTIGFNPHSVGLQHSDAPRRTDTVVPAPMDLTLEPGMILSVDCPLLDEGVGGSGHLEDLTLITADGSERIHPDTPHVLVV